MTRMESQQIKSKGGSPEEHPDRPPQSYCIVFCIINKAGYNDIVNQLTEMRSGKDAIWYVMALIDVLDHMSIEIFEHYKSLQEIFKKTIKCIPLGGDAKMQKVCMGYAILKACNIGILNPEKYLETGRTLIDGAIDEPFDQKDDVSMGIMMMAYAQFIRVM